MSEDTTITYNSLYSIVRNEKKNKSLQSLPKEFYKTLNNFLKSKKEEIIELKQKKDSTNFKRQKKLFENINSMKFEFINLRLSKISNISISNSIYEKEILETHTILDEEKFFFLENKKLVKDFMESI